MTAHGVATATAAVNRVRLARRQTGSRITESVMSRTCIIDEPRAAGPRGALATHTRSAFWSLWQAAVMIGAPLLSLAVPGALAYFAYETLGCTLAQL
jgi:hypothetical protein